MVPDRFGKSSDDVNKDGYFDDDGEDDVYVDSESSFEPKSGRSSETNSSKNDSLIGKSKIEPRTQMARIEAKLDIVIDTVQKIQRTIISMATNPTTVDVSNVDCNFLSIFPLKTEESMDKFERDLNDNAFRRMFFITFSNLLLHHKKLHVI